MNFRQEIGNPKKRIAQKPATRLFTGNNNVMPAQINPDNSWVEDAEFDATPSALQTETAIKAEPSSNIKITEPDTLGNFLLSETPDNRKTRTEMMFKFKYFFITFIDHFLFFMLLGPFIYFLGCCGNMNRLRNQGFVGFNKIFVIQTLIWLFVISSSLIFFLAKPSQNITPIELLMTYFSILIRCIFIAVKYAYCSEDYLRAFMKRRLTEDEIKSELMSTTWRRQTDSVVEKELQSIILREDIDCSLFFFNFIGCNDKELTKRLLKSSGVSQRRVYSLVPAYNFDKKLRNMLGLSLPVKERRRRGTRVSKSCRKSSENLSTLKRENVGVNLVGRCSSLIPKSSAENELEKRDSFISDNLNLNKQQSEKVTPEKSMGVSCKRIDLEAQNSPNDQIVLKIKESMNQVKEDSRQNSMNEDLRNNMKVGSINDIGKTSFCSNPDKKELVTQEPILTTENLDHVNQFGTLSPRQSIDIRRLKDDEKLRYQTHELVTLEFQRILSRSVKFETKKLFGYSLALDLLHHARKERFLKDGWCAFAVAIIRALLPTFYRLYENKDDGVIGKTWSDHYIVFSLMIASCYFFWGNFFVVLQAVSDYRVKRFLMLQLGNLIAAREVGGCYEKRLYPTLNFFDPITVKMWVSLRKILWQYGSKYQIRQDLDITIFTVFYLILTIVLILQWLEWLKVDLSTMAVLLISAECLIGAILFGYMLVLAALINDTFNFHMNLLKKIKVICGDMLHLDFIYFGKRNFEAHSYVYRAGVQMLIRELGGDKIGDDPKNVQIYLQKLETRLSKLITMLGEEIEDLGFELINNPYKILGFTIDWKLISTLALGVGSIIFGVVKEQF